MAATEVAERQLAAQIRLAYLEVARATRVEELADSTLELLRENLRTAESLVANGAATPDAVLRARADRSEGEQRQADAGRLRATAIQSFNLLLERPLDAEVPLVADSGLGIGLRTPLDTAVVHGLAAREELRQLEAGTRVAQGQERLARSAFLPSLVAAVDYGFQGEQYRFAGNRDFLVASLVLQWNLFNGGQDKARRDEARLEAERFRTARAASAREVELEIRTAWRAALVSRQALVTATDRLASAERNYGLVERKHRAGAASQLELIDARTSYTSARLNLILTTYDYFARCVDFERAAALYPEHVSAGGDDR
jgi:outer membrane protein TolC